MLVKLYTYQKGNFTYWGIEDDSLGLYSTGWARSAPAMYVIKDFYSNHKQDPLPNLKKHYANACIKSNPFIHLEQDWENVQRYYAKDYLPYSYYGCCKNHLQKLMFTGKI